MANPILENGVGSPQSIYESFAPGGLNGVNGGHHPIGTKARIDERVFYYASHSASNTLTLGLVYGNPAPNANDQNRVWAGTAGSRVITVTCGAAVPANLYAGGYFLADSGTGAGQYFRIQSHTVADGSFIITATLFDPVVVTAAASPTGSLCKHPYVDNVVFPGNSQAAVVIGVPQVTVPGGNVNQQYYWTQTAGPAALSCEGAVTIGQGIVPATAATSDAGQGKAAVEFGTVAVQDMLPLIGHVLIANGTDEHHALVYLTIRE